MSGYLVEIAPGAEHDIEDGFRWYRERNALVADGFRIEVFETIDKIGASPLSRPPDDDGNRHRVLRRFPYSVYYEVVESTVTVLAVAHHRREPNYWLGIRR